MKIQILNLVLMFLLLGCGNAEQSSLNNANHILEEQHKSRVNLELEFPVKPETMNELLPIKGQQVNLVSKVANTENGIYVLFDIELGELADEVKRDQTGFFNGMLSYLISDLGAEYENLSEYEYNGYKGNNFDILSPNTEEKTTAKGKTLLADDKAFIWFGVSNSQDSSERVNTFINSYKLK